MDDDAAARSLGSSASSTPRVEALPDKGALAQLGERRARTTDVAGSFPAGSTMNDPFSRLVRMCDLEEIWG